MSSLDRATERIGKVGHGGSVEQRRKPVCACVDASECTCSLLVCLGRNLSKEGETKWVSATTTE